MHNYLPSSASSIQPIPPEMDSTGGGCSAAVPDRPLDEESVPALWDWSDLLDFTLDDELTFPVDPEQHPLLAPAVPPMVPEITPDLTGQESPPPQPDNSPGRIRKRDPRLTCSNFLAGKVPCACPEIDEKLEEEAGGLPGKKRARTVRVVSAGSARCQVPGCEADISELKGYHKRHRVCLPCASASSVVLDGQSKRYCQQCGKFHILSDFDKGKRSCRRKLERHNNRRRRKPSDLKGHTEKDPQQNILSEDIGCDDETGEDSTCLSGQLLERDMLLESEGCNPNLSSARVCQTIHNDSSAYGETKIDGDKDNSNNTLSPSDCVDKILFSSVCPTGRVSFKLYDWNPAEFPRRLRHQIFQWLASMPVELEGYIRPGCTILTVFIAMPKFMWDKLHEDPNKHVQDFIVAPGSLLFGRGTFFVYLNHFIFHVRDGISVTKLEMGEQAPKLHYVHPPCFEAGKPMEFIACGSNLLRSNFRFLISFSGKYLAYDFCVKLLNPKPEGDTTCDHQMLKINVPCTEADVFGPAFIEVENESGLSNFIPVLIGDKKVCSEMKRMQQSFDRSFCMKGSLHGASNSLCEVSKLRQTEFSEFLLDIAWLLKKPAVENVQHMLTSSQVQRLNRLLSFLIKHESIAILERALCYMMIVKDNCPPTCVAGVDIKHFESNLHQAADIVRQKLQRENLVMHPRNCVAKGEGVDRSSNSDMLSIPVCSQDVESREEDKLDAVAGSTPADKNGTLPLLNGEAFTSVNFGREQPRKPGNRILKSRILTSRPFVFVVAAAAGCCGICAVLLHPQKVSELAVTIHRCLFDDT